jgi:hypothetical protein
MKLPALAIAACVAAGILAGGFAAAYLPHALPLCLAIALCLLLFGFTVLALGRVTAAWAACLLAWCLLGAAAAQLESLATRADNVAHLSATDRLDLTEPLRWRGRLRADPLRLPWGIRYDIDLEEAEEAGTWMPVSGGLQVSYFFDERAAQDPAPLRAGDRVEALVRARPVRNFCDPGAFEYRTFLARQNIDLTASLRSTELLEKLPGPPPTLAHRLAHSARAPAR